MRELDGRPIGAAGRPVTETVRAAFRRYIETGPARWASESRAKIAV